MNELTFPENVKLQPLLICIVRPCAWTVLAAPNASPRQTSPIRFIGALPLRVELTDPRQPAAKLELPLHQRHHRFALRLPDETACASPPRALVRGTARPDRPAAP